MSTPGCVQRGFNGNVLRGYPTSGCVQRGFNGNVQRSVSRGGQNKCPGVGEGGGGGGGVEALCPGGDTLILVISRGVQLYYGIAQCICNS